MLTFRLSFFVSGTRAGIHRIDSTLDYHVAPQTSRLFVDGPLDPSTALSEFHLHPLCSASADAPFDSSSFETFARISVCDADWGGSFTWFGHAPPSPCAGDMTRRQRNPILPAVLAQRCDAPLGRSGVVNGQKLSRTS